MAERINQQARWSRLKRALKSAVVAEKGQVACIDTADGALTIVSGIATLVAIGTFEESFTGDGTRLMSVKLFTEIDLHLMANQTTGQVTDADVGKNCYLHSAASEVSMTAGTKSVAGRVWGVVGTTGVWVQMVTA